MTPDDPGVSIKIQDLPSSLEIASGTVLELAALCGLAVLFPMQRMLTAPW